MAGSREVLLQMWGPFRKSLIAQHLFYMEQARTRLLSQFENIEAEAHKAADAWLEANQASFDPDLHDMGDAYEASNDAGIEFYQLLSDMRDQTRLSVVAGMFHEWDKQLRDWLSQEIRHLFPGETVNSKLWSVNFVQIAELLQGLGWDIRSGAYYAKLDACRCVVNVYKHGNGNSLDELKRSYPEFLVSSFSTMAEFSPNVDWLDHTYVTVSDQQIEAFSDAILAFWRDVPENTFAAEELQVPDWFEKAVSKDREARSPK